MKILVTGGAGFIGAHLARRLTDEGHAVVSIDTLATEYPELHQRRMTELVPDVPLERIDLLDIDALQTLFATHQFEVVYHLAAKPGVRQSLQHPQLFARVNYEGTVNIFECARVHNVPKVLFASSSSVYGQSDAVPFSEAQDVNAPFSIYAATKRAGELLAQTYVSLYGMNITALRFFTVYGPYGRPDMAPWIFTERIARGEPINIYDNGNHHRDFTFISDIIDGCVALLTRQRHGYHCYNLGQGKTVALLDFIAVIESVLETSAEKIFLPAQPGDVNNTYADTTKAREELGFIPKVSIEEGMSTFIEWYTHAYPTHR